MFPSSAKCNKKAGRTYSRQSKRVRCDGDARAIGRRVDGRGGLVVAEGHEDAGAAEAMSSPIRGCDALLSSSPLPPPTFANKPLASSSQPLPTFEDKPLASSPQPPPTSDAPLASSPQPPPTFSDALTRSSSPPSSPALDSSPPPDTRRRPVFSLFKRKLKHSVSAPEALSDLPPKKRMVQMQLDLVGQHRKACPTCGMEYIPSNAEDVALHAKFHAMNFGGVDCTKAMVERLRQKQVSSGGGGSFTAVVGRRDALALRNKASDVLKVVNAELAAVPVTDEELWSQTTLSASAESPGADTVITRRDKCGRHDDTATTALDKCGRYSDTTTALDRCDRYSDTTTALDKCGRYSDTTTALDRCDRYKVYLHIQGQKCVAACLAERIQSAYTVLAQKTAESPSSSISISTAADKAVLGISRIWVSSQLRKQGVARRLLDCARSDFMYGLTVQKHLTAFSQPTESGGKLARSYFGSEAGWHVYVD